MSGSRFNQPCNQKSAHYNRLASATGTNYHHLAAANAAFSEDSSDARLLRGSHLFDRQHYEKHFDVSSYPRSHLYVFNPLQERAGNFWYADSGADDYYQVYAWDVVDIFFATIVASLPALNGVVDAGLGKMKALGSTSASTLLSRLRAFGNSSPDTRDYDTQLSDKGAGKLFRDGFGAVEGVKKSRNASDQFDEPILNREADIELQRPGEPFGHGTAL